MRANIRRPTWRELGQTWAAKREAKVRNWRILLILGSLSTIIACALGLAGVTISLVLLDEANHVNNVPEGIYDGEPLSFWMWKVWAKDAKCVGPLVKALNSANQKDRVKAAEYLGILGM